MLESKLEQLRQMTTIVADTGDIDSIKQYRPTDATTNPSLILSAMQKPEYHYLIEESMQYCKLNNRAKDLHFLIDVLFVKVGVEILKLIPGRISTEVDARLSFDVEGSIEKAKLLIGLYEEMGIDKKRILIKLASTWEGGLAAAQLEKEGIHCNMTLLFSLPQAIHCAQSGATLISPFVGRILDWYKQHNKVEGYPSAEDPGVLSVSQIYDYFKKFGYKTQIMGASFRNKEEILELAGCDLLTIAPQLLDELSKAQGEVPKKLDAEISRHKSLDKIDLDEKTFRFMLNEDAMATEKLAEGIRNFGKAFVDLEKLIQKLL